MKVLQVVHGWFPRHAGGTERYVAWLASQLDRKGLKNSILAGSEEGRDEATVEVTKWRDHPLFKLHRSGLNLDSWYRSYDPDAEALFLAVLDNVRPDIVHVHHWRRLTRNLVELATDHGIPVVATLHDTSVTCPRLFRLRNESFCELPVTAGHCHDCVERFWFQDEAEVGVQVESYRDDFRQEMNLVNRIIAPSRALADFVPRYATFDPERLEILQPPHFTTTPTSHPGVSETNGPVRLVYWGALQRVKGIDVLVEAAARLPRDLRWRLDIWGDFDQESDEAFERRVTDAAAELPIRFRGPFKDGVIPHSEYDLAVFPSVGLESHSFTVDEAMAAGLPMIVPDRGAPKERLGRGGTTFVAEDVDDLAAVLSEALGDRRKISSWQAAVRSPIDDGSHIDSIRAVYAAAVAEGPLRDRIDDGVRLGRMRAFAAQLRSRDERAWWLRGRVQQEQDRAEGLRDEVDSRDHTVAEKEGVLSDFNASLGEMSKVIRARDLETARLAAQHDRERSKLEDGIDERDEIIRSRDEAIREQTRESNLLHDELGELRATIRERGAELKARDDELSFHGASIAELKRDLAEREAAHQELGDERIDLARRLESESAHNATLAEKIAALQDSMSRQSAIIEAEYEQNLGDVSTELETVREILEATQADAEQLRSSLEQADSELAEIRLEFVDVETALGTATSDLDEVRQMSAAENAIAADLRDRLKETEQELATASQQMGAASVRADALHRASVERTDQLEEALEKRDVALRQALADLACAGQPDEIDGEAVEMMRRRLEPIGEESAGKSLTDEGLGALVDHVVRNHERLHGLIAERDTLLATLADQVASSGGKPADVPRKERGSRVSKFKNKVRALKRKVKPRRAGRLKILFVVHDFLPKHVAGTEIYTFNLARELSARHDIHLLFCESRHEQPRYTVSNGRHEGLPFTEVVHNYQWENFEETYVDPRMEEIFRDVLEREKPDIVHIQHLHYFSIEFIRIAKEAGIPVVFTLHEFMLMCARGGQLVREDLEICEAPEPMKCADCIRHQPLSGDYGRPPEERSIRGLASFIPDSLQEAFERFAGPSVPAELTPELREVYAKAAAQRLELIGDRMQLVDLFISPSAFLRQKFVDVGMTRPDQIIHSDNGFDLTTFQGHAPIPSSKLRFGFVGTIAEYKGVHVMIEAFNEITADNVELQIWGDVETFQEYKARILPLVRNDRIRLMGRFDPHQISRVLAEIDVLIVPSLWFENSPLTIHEAWMAGIPVIASNRGGMAELVDDGVGGLHFELGDPNDLREKVQRIIDDRTLLETFKQGLGEVKDIIDNAVELEGYYRDLVSGDSVQEVD